MLVRDLIKMLLEFNLDATVSVNGLFDESESVNFSWVSDDDGSGVDDRKSCRHLFLETDNRNDESENIDGGGV